MCLVVAMNGKRRGELLNKSGQTAAQQKKMNTQPQTDTHSLRITISAIASKDNGMRENGNVFARPSVVVVECGADELICVCMAVAAAAAVAAHSK